MTDSARTRAERLLEHDPVVDGHNDLPWALRTLVGSQASLGDFGRIDLTVEQPELHTDLLRLRRGKVGGQFWSVYVPCHYTGHSAVTAVLEQIELVHALVARYPEYLALARTAEEASQALATGRVASLLGAEGGHCIAESLGVLRVLHRLGVRYMTLTHNENVPWADSATDEPRVGGLTDFGREVVREMNRLGMLVDLSHVAASTMRDALAVAGAPVLFTHSNCQAVVDNPRNVPDDVLVRLPDNGGVCMLTFVARLVSGDVGDWQAEVRAAMVAAGEDPGNRAAATAFTSRWRSEHPKPEATIQDVVAHIEHAREVAGIDHIGLGGDYDGTPELPTGLKDVSGYPALFAELLDRGWSELDCAKLAGRNVLRVLREAESVASAHKAD